MSGWNLFKQRFLSDFHYQRKVIGSVIDWVVALYTVIPGIAIAVYFYADIWQNPHLYWTETIPLTAVIGGLLLFALGGNFRTFMMEADILFLLNNAKLYTNMRKWTFGYSLLRLAGSTALLIAAVLPILAEIYGIAAGEVLSLFSLILGYRLTVFTLKKIIRHPVRLWLGVLFPFYILTMFAASRLSLIWLGFIGLFLFIYVMMRHIRSHLPAKRYFSKEIEMESKAHHRYIRLIFGLSAETPKTPVKLSKGPLILRRGQRLFREKSPENGLLEILLKGFFRNSVYIDTYLRFILLTIFAIIFTPIWVKWLVFFIFVLFSYHSSWLRGVFEQLLDEDFFTVVPFDESIRDSVWLRFRQILVVPAVIFAGIITILMSFIAIWSGF